MLIFQENIVQVDYLAEFLRVESCELINHRKKSLKLNNSRLKKYGNLHLVKFVYFGKAEANAILICINSFSDKFPRSNKSPFFAVF